MDRLFGEEEVTDPLLVANFEQRVQKFGYVRNELSVLSDISFECVSVEWGLGKSRCHLHGDDCNKSRGRYEKMMMKWQHGDKTQEEDAVRLPMQSLKVVNIQLSDGTADRLYKRG